MSMPEETYKQTYKAQQCTWKQQLDDAILPVVIDKAKCYCICIHEEVEA